LRATGGKGALMHYYRYYRAAGHKSVIKGTVQRELRGSKYVLFSFLLCHCNQTVIGPIIQRNKNNVMYNTSMFFSFLGTKEVGKVTSIF
jgi:hypothetical protein